MIENRERHYLNTIKGTAIFLMLWGHCIQYCSANSFDFFLNTAFKTIYSFHMPLFMLISGYLYYFSFIKRDLKTLLIHKTQSMLHPIVFANALNMFLISIPTLLKEGIYCLLNGTLIDDIYSFWFLWCVLSSSLAVGISCKISDRMWIQILNITLGIFFVALFPDLHSHLYMYPYFVIGFFYGKYRQRIPDSWKKCSCLALPAFPVMMLFYQKKHYIYITPIFDFSKPILTWASVSAFRWIIGLVGSIFMIDILKRLHNAFYDRRSGCSILLNFVSKLGENSLSVYCLSVSLLSYYLPRLYNLFVDMAGRNVFAENMFFFNLVFTPALACIYSLVLYAIILVLKKYKLHRIIFGK